MDRRVRRLARAANTPQEKKTLYHERLRRSPDLCPKCDDESGTVAKSEHVPGSDGKCCCTMCYWSKWDARMMGKPKTKRCLDCPLLERKEMPTFNQLVRKGRKKQRNKTNRVLGGSPQLEGTILRIFILNPKKPNSGDKKCARVKLSNGHEITAYIPGQGLGGASEHSRVLIKAGGPHDTPGVNFTVIRGVSDCGDESNKQINGEKFIRRNSRSKYGAKKPKA